MDKHTFKVGDRVLFIHDKREIGTISKRHEEITGNWLVLRDDGYSEAWAPYYTYRECDLEHDTDFQVGDWVRYEAIEPYTKGYDTEDGKVGQITHLGQEFATIKGELKEERFISNLVKIQPPSVEFNDCIVHDYPPHKDDDDTIIHMFTSYTDKGEKNMRNVFNITHEKYGVVQGVHQVAPGCYCKNGAYYYHGEGWREVEEWVKIEVRKSQWDNVNNCCNVLEVQKKSEDYPDTCTLSWRYPQ